MHISYTATASYKHSTPEPTVLALAPGERVITPLIAGSVCGGLLAIAWLIGFTIYFTKRYQRKRFKRQLETGLINPGEGKGKGRETEKRFIIPPDPAITMQQDTCALANVQSQTESSLSKVHSAAPLPLKEFKQTSPIITPRIEITEEIVIPRNV
ncbi:hypothetical protein AX16_005242 [Volvariella volvacea WC 439]|nr:hypothetical protein AX16_005242 [Volvariella volvacea WC 439]